MLKIMNGFNVKAKNLSLFIALEVWVGYILWHVFSAVHNMMYPNLEAGNNMYIAIGITTYYTSELIIKVVKWLAEIRYEARTEFAGYNQR